MPFVIEEAFDFLPCFPEGEQRVQISLDGPLTSLHDLFPAFPRRFNVEQALAFEQVLELIDQAQTSKNHEGALDLIARSKDFSETPEVKYRSMLSLRELGRIDDTIPLALELSTVRFADFSALMEIVQTLPTHISSYATLSACSVCMMTTARADTGQPTSGLCSAIQVFCARSARSPSPSR